MKQNRYVRISDLLNGWLLILLTFSSVIGFAQEDAVGVVSALTGRADVFRGDQPPLAMTEQDPVFRGDILQTQADSELELQMSDGSSFILDQNTRLVLSQYLPDQEPEGLFELIRGRLRSFISSNFSHRSDSFQVDTKEGRMGVQGTVFDVYALPAETQVYVYEGLVSVTAHDPGFRQTRLIGAGEFSRITPGAPAQPPRPFNSRQHRPPQRRKNSGLRSGGSQDLRSGGRQGRDPTRRAPRGPELFNQPPPNPMDDMGQMGDGQSGG